MRVEQRPHGFVVVLVGASREAADRHRDGRVGERWRAASPLQDVARVVVGAFPRGSFRL